MSKNRILALLLALMLLLGCTGALAQQAQRSTVLDYYLAPDAIAKPMARMWFPDASAGVDENDTIAKQIQELAKEGFGGVEIAFLADASDYSNDQLTYGGWGTQAWVELLKKVYRAANAIEDGFVVDLTITSHWPPALNTIDPNDEAASQELSSSFTKVTKDMLDKGVADIELPETRTQDELLANFIFVDKLSSAVLAQVTANEDGLLTVDFNSIRSLETSKVTYEDVSGLEEGSYKLEDGAYYAGSAAGVPDEETCQANGWIYSDPQEDQQYTNLTNSVVGWFGPEPGEDADFSQSWNGKVDQYGNRKRMADWQYRYQADLTGLDLGELDQDDQLEAGDWVIISAFTRGTGQIFSGRAGQLHKQTTMYNRLYVTNYFNETGIEVVADYWDKYILCDEELVELMRVNGALGASIFEDSIEASCETSYWTEDIAQEIAAYYGEDYVFLTQLPAVMVGYAEEVTEQMAAFGEEPGVNLLDFSGVDEDVVRRIEEDYNLLMGHLYNTQHCEVSNEWANSIGYSYRAQTYSITGMDIAGAAATVNIPEAESAQNGDGHRLMSSAVNMFDKQCLSMESVTGAMIYQFNWEDVLFALNSNFSYGVNHVILHGSAYSKSLNGALADWPGWDPFIASFGEPYTYRQVYWEDMEMLTNYLARNQAVLQHGVAKIDVAVLIDGAEVFSSPSGNSLPTLLDYGYSYNLMSEAILKSEHAQKTEGGVIYQEGPAYKAVVLNGVSTISPQAMDILISYAQAGIPIVSLNSDPSTVYGSEKGGQTDAAVAEKYQTLLSYDCVVTCADEAALPQVLAELGVTGYAQYDRPMNLEATMYQDKQDGTNYYYLFNCTEVTSGMLTAGSAKKYKVTEGTNEAIYDAVVTLAGTGVPYILDAMTGEVTQVAEYTDNGDGTITLVIDQLNAANSMLVAISQSGQFPQAQAYVTQVDADKADYRIARVDGQLKFIIEKAGTYQVTTSDGQAHTLTVEADAPTLDLTDATWQLVIDSYGPTYKDASTMVDERGIQTVDPSDTTITTVDFGETALCNWEEIQATEEQLSALGVDSMADVSGKGYYTATFDWAGGGAVLHLAYGNDQVTGITVNGQQIYPINNMSDRLDLGGYLLEGENTITIEVSSTLSARANVEHAALREGSGLHFGGQVFDTNGLTQVVLEGYCEVGI